jgi:hypothetical protein
MLQFALMPTERLVIENFKGISHHDLEVRPFTVLIGPQSVGKSVTAKLLYYFKNLPLELFNAAIGVRAEDSEKSLDSWLSGRFDRLLPRPNRATGNSILKYSIGDATFSLQSNGDDYSPWQISLPEFLRAEFAAIKAEYSDMARNKQDQRSLLALWGLRASLQDGFLKRLEEKLGQRMPPLLPFIPAGRSFYAQVERDSASFFESARLDPFVAEFGKFLAYLRDPSSSPLRPPSQQSDHASRLIDHLLGGKYYREGQRDFIASQDGRKVPMPLWSSGQQESFPLVFLLHKCAEGSLKPLRGTWLFIEEPEAHLFPGSQKIMIELISLAVNSENKHLNVFITTHSPYVLSTLNILIRAGQLFQPGPTASKHAAISRIVPELEALAPGSLGAYSMDRNECRSIMDAETGLIDGRAIDDVSGELAEQFDALNDLK